ncbi:FAD-dependent oxidoreductase [Mycolicibacterium litorale]|uniref:FAD-dependent oxidoreductase n=1 Tax=Mycolicibacterium litorale TaxID=758802 RepID=UPI003CEB6A42
MVDVVVVGSGAAGVAAAITAARNGASVQVMEKTDQLGGAYGCSGGEVWIPCNDRMVEAGLDDSFEDAVRYVKGLSHDGRFDPALIERFIRKGAKAIRFLEQNSAYRTEIAAANGDHLPRLARSKPTGRLLVPAALDARRVLGGTRRWVRDVPNGKSAVRQGFSETVRSGGPALVTGLVRGALDAGVMFRRNCTVSRLMVESGEVVGTVLDQGADRFEVLARRGVILACGGLVDGQHLVAATSTREGLVWTHEGLRTDVDGRVKAARGGVIDGLYAVGAVAVDVLGDRHPGPGAALGSYLTFGYLAGRHAAHSPVRPVDAQLIV